MLWNTATSSPNYFVSHYLSSPPRLCTVYETLGCWIWCGFGIAASWTACKGLLRLGVCLHLNRKNLYHLFHPLPSPKHRTINYPGAEFTFILSVKIKFLKVIYIIRNDNAVNFILGFLKNALVCWAVAFSQPPAPTPHCFFLPHLFIPKVTGVRVPPKALLSWPCLGRNIFISFVRLWLLIAWCFILLFKTDRN